MSKQLSMTEVKMLLEQNREITVEEVIQVRDSKAVESVEYKPEIADNFYSANLVNGQRRSFFMKKQ